MISEERFDAITQLCTTLEEYGQRVPWEEIEQIKAIAAVRDPAELPGLIQRTQVDVLEPDPTNFIIATSAVIAMKHYPPEEVEAALRTFLACNTVTHFGSKRGIVAILRKLPRNAYTESLLTEYTKDSHAIVRREAEWALKYPFPVATPNPNPA